MGETDDGLDAISRKLLLGIDELKRLELEKRQTARSTDDFHDLASKVEDTSRHIFEVAKSELAEGDDDSPIPAERAEQDAGDWTDGNRI